MMKECTVLYQVKEGKRDGNRLPCIFCVLLIDCVHTYTCAWLIEGSAWLLPGMPGFISPQRI